MKSRSKEDELITNSLISAYQLSETEGTKRAVLTELYGLWNKTISNFVWSFVGGNRFNLDCIEASSGLKFEDLEQEAFFGFRKTVETYKPLEAKFSTYLFIGIRNHLHCYLSKARRGHHNFTWLDQMKGARFNGKNGFSLDDLWQLHLDISSYDEHLIFETRRNGKFSEQKYTRNGFSSKVLNTLNAKRFQEPISLDSLMDSEEPADLDSLEPDQASEEKELTIKLKNLLLSLLNDRLRLILTARYGLNLFSDEIKALGFEPGISYSNASIGRKIGLTRERARQLKNIGLKRFKTDARMDVLKSVLDDYLFDKCSSVESD